MKHCDVRAETATPAGSPVRILFVATILTGSLLLFLVQPMVARMALPRLGGAPAVWNSAMLVYQALLLGGYAYAHALGRLTPGRQALVHVGLMLAAACWLPIGLARIEMPAGVTPALWVPWLLSLSIGPLFFVVAAQAPLIQRWFALRFPGANPYSLYAASNLGSFGGLLAYPLLVEPTLTVAHQSLLWTLGYAALVALVLACCATRRTTGHQPDLAGDAVAASPPPSLRDRARWVALAAVPSGLMLSTTTHLTTDIVAMPLIWVVPLGLYLLSFSVAFAARDRVPLGIARTFPVMLVAGAQTAFANAAAYPLLSAATNLALLFVVAVTLHREMYRTRPGTAHLTGFYLAMSVGGVVGGLFCALAAPLLFDWAYEHPLLIVAAALLMPQASLFGWLARLRADPERAARLTRWLGLATGLLALAAGGFLGGDPSPGIALAIIGLLASAAFVAVGRRALFGLAIVAVMLASGGWQTMLQSFVSGKRVRSYYGIYTVADQADATRILIHGTTTHGVQRTAPGHERDATSYYAPLSGVGLAMTAAPALFGPSARIGVVGLGAGTLACYARPGQDWRFYEIDPAVVAIARDPRRFTFLSRCTPGVPIEIGDARLSLSRAPAGGLDLLVVDAFSSDSVPMHLLTREALGVYRRALAPGGLLMVHISNRFFDLEPVLAAAARADGLAAALRDYTPDARAAKAAAARSIWVALSPDPRTLARLTAGRADGWRPLVDRPGFRAWSDDYGSVLPVLRGLR
ncbi:spermidine synthase [Sphingomonas profundi]|uniref:spermidine synthase n=1 Tax=Alterirhizorhabdus profundi TaxID=2681549 RepID=UPI0012E8BA0F|nr:fused MFS/spermidine synthase [Sphingomonas profundi]